MTAAIVVRKARDQLHLRRLSILGKMRFLLIIATLLVTYFVDAHVNGWSIKEISLLSKKFKVNNRDQVESLGVRQIRDATNCEEAYVETESPVFEECLEFLSLDSEEYSPQQLDLFCNERHCPGILRPVFRDIAILCHESEVSAFITVKTICFFSSIAHMQYGLVPTRGWGLQTLCTLRIFFRGQNLDRIFFLIFALH